MTLLAVFLASDHQTLITRKVAHVQSNEEEIEGDLVMITNVFLLHRGLLAHVESAWAEEHIGIFVGLIEEGDSPESLRDEANQAAVEADSPSIMTH